MKDKLRHIPSFNEYGTELHGTTRIKAKHAEQNPQGVGVYIQDVICKAYIKVRNIQTHTV